MNFRIEANGYDVTQKLMRHLLSLRLIDEIGISADEVSIKVTNQFKRPKYGDEIKVWIAGAYYGLFIVQTTTKTHTDLTIKATATNFTNTLKKKHNRSFENIKICELIAKIAAENSLRYKCDGDFLFRHLAQTNESDLNLLARVAKDLGAQFNIKNDTIIFLKHKEENTALPKFHIDKKEVLSYSIKHNAKTIYKSIKAIWHDTKTNRQKEISYRSGEPQYILRSSFNNEAEAFKKAKALYQTLNRGSVNGDLTIPGKEIRAGGVLVLRNFGEDDGEYSIKRVVHTIDSSGYRARVEFEN